MKEKLLSGRLWLTIIAGYVFAWCAIHETLGTDAVCAIVSSVFVSYFQRADRIDPPKQ